MHAHRRPARLLALGLVALALAPLALQAAVALPPLAAPAGARVTLWAPARVGANHTFLVAGQLEIRPAEGALAAPWPDQRVLVALDGLDVAEATTDTSGRFTLAIPAIAAAGHHDLTARAMDAGLVLAASDAAPVLVVLPPLAPATLTGGPGRHTGDVALAWTPPPVDELRPVDGYVVWRDASPAPFALRVVPARTLEASDNRPLDAPASYRIAAFNAAGAGAPTAWVAVIPAPPPWADDLQVATSSVDVCHAGSCVNLAPYDIAFVGGDDLPVDLRVHATGALRNGATPVDLEPWNGTVWTNSTDNLRWLVTPPVPFSGKTGADGTFALSTPAVRVPNVRANQTCLAEILTVGAHYPGVSVPAGVAAPDLAAASTIKIYLC